jgi:fumarate hydratase subunit alpha
MEKITEKKITNLVERLIIKAAFELRSDVRQALRASFKREKSTCSRSTLDIILENARLARRHKIPLCQDTGMTVVYCDVGSDVGLKGISVERAIQKGITQATRRGRLRHSIVQSPFKRINTKTNGPGIIHYKCVRGRALTVKVMLKGFGCENKGAVSLFNPTAGRAEVLDYIVKTIKAAGANACPPFVVGVGIGGTLDKACELSKEVLFRRLAKKNPISYLNTMEREIEQRVNASGIGPLGFGGKSTVLKVFMEEFPTHIAGLPVAININCHSLRTAVGKLTG